MTLAAAAIAAPLVRGVARAGEATPLPGAGRIVLAIDVSRSMAVADVAPDRMTRARTAAFRLTTELPDASVGLVAFAARAYALLPPTHDRGLLLRYLDALDPRMLSAQGSRLAGAVDAALKELETRESGAAPTGPRAIVLVTDGESFDPDRRVAAALARARTEGVSLYAVSVGTPEGGLVPGAGALSTARPARLKVLLRTAGGYAADAGRTAEMTAVVGKLRARFAAEPGPEGAAPPRPGAVAEWFTGLALLALSLEAALALYRPARHACPASYRSRATA